MSFGKEIAFSYMMTSTNRMRARNPPTKALYTEDKRPPPVLSHWSVPTLQVFISIPMTPNLVLLWTFNKAVIQYYITLLPKLKIFYSFSDNFTHVYNVFNHIHPIILPPLGFSKQ